MSRSPLRSRSRRLPSIPRRSTRSSPRSWPAGARRSSNAGRAPAASSMAPEPLGALLVESLVVPLAVMAPKLVDDVLINDFDSLALRDEILIH